MTFFGEGHPSKKSPQPRQRTYRLLYFRGNYLFDAWAGKACQIRCKADQVDYSLVVAMTFLIGLCYVKTLRNMAGEILDTKRGVPAGKLRSCLRDLEVLCLKLIRVMSARSARDLI
jgi:hypothetical protein